MDIERQMERYETFIKNSSEGIWLFEVDEPIPVSLPPKEQIRLMYKHAYLAEANDALAKMYAMKSRHELEGVRLGQMLLEDDPQNIAYLTAFVESGYSLSDVESHEKDARGNDKYFRNSLIGIVEDGKLVRAWGTQRDVTEQKLATETLQRSEERLTLALKVSNIGIWEWDIQNDILTWTDELKILFGLKPSVNVTYKKYLQMIHPEDRAKIQDLIKRAMKHSEEYRVEHRVVWPDKSVHWILSRGKSYSRNGKAVRMTGTAVNIDERKRTIQQLEESEARFRTLADTAPVLIWMSDAQNMGTYFNKTWLEFTGRSLEQEMGIGWTASVHPDDVGRAAAYCQKCFDKRKPFRMEFRLRRADGQYRWVLDHGVPRYDHEGNFLGYIGSCMDTEEIKRSKKRKEEVEEINQKLKQQRRQLVALNRSKDEFISLASHQLRTPATGVKQYIGLLLEGYIGHLDDDQRRMLEAANESNERQLTIINDLLRVAQVDAGKVELRKTKTDIVNLLSKVIDEQKDKFKNRHQIVTLKRPKATVVVTVDPHRIRMVLENLIDNASKYTPDNKAITVKITATAKAVSIHVADEGIGIRKQDLSKLFQKFSRLDNSLASNVGGTGLGLYWAKKIITLHNGDLTVESSPGKGSTFTVTIPRS